MKERKNERENPVRFTEARKQEKVQMKKVKHFCAKRKSKDTDSHKCFHQTEDCIKQKVCGWNNGGSECCFPLRQALWLGEKKFGYQTFYKKEENSEGEGARNLSAQDENLTAMKNEIN